MGSWKASVIVHRLPCLCGKWGKNSEKQTVRKARKIMSDNGQDGKALSVCQHNRKGRVTLPDRMKSALMEDYYVVLIWFVKR